MSLAWETLLILIFLYIPVYNTIKFVAENRVQKLRAILYTNGIKSYFHKKIYMEGQVYKQ